MDNERAPVEPTEGEKLAHAGVYVTLGGSPVRIVMDARALKALEAKYGSLLNLGSALEKGGEDAPVFTLLVDCLTAMARGLPPHVEVVDLVDLDRMTEYGEKLLEAFKLSGLWSADPNGRGPATGRSSGRRSNTRASSRSGARKTSSGR